MITICSVTLKAAALLSATGCGEWQGALAGEQTALELSDLEKHAYYFSWFAGGQGRIVGLVLPC